MLTSLRGGLHPQGGNSSSWSVTPLRYLMQSLNYTFCPVFCFTEEIPDHSALPAPQIVVGPPGPTGPIGPSGRNRIQSFLLPG